MPPGSAPRAFQPKLDAFVTKWVADNPELATVGGISVAVATENEVLAAAGGRAGSAERPLTPATWLHLGSLTKTYTATAILRLAAAKRLDLDAPVATWVADAPAAATTTVRQLLAMTAGLPEYAGTDAWIEAITADFTRSFSLADIMTLVPTTPPAPGPWVYCNTCYVVAGQVLEAVTKTDYRTAYRTEVLEPLGLRETDATREGHDVAEGTLIFGEGAQPVQTATLGSYRSIESSAGTAGSMVGTPSDVARFGWKLLAGEALTAEGWEQMTAFDPVSGYGLGLADFAPSTAGSPAPIRALGNYGEISGYTAALLLDRNLRRVIVVMTNDDRASGLDAAAALQSALDAP